MTHAIQGRLELLEKAKALDELIRNQSMDSKYVQQRQFVLEKYNILDTEPERDFDELAKLASYICGCKYGYISFVDKVRRRVFAKASVDGTYSKESTPAHEAVCFDAVDHQGYFCVPDLLQEPRYSNLACTKEPLFMRFYAGFPITTCCNFRLGMLCVVDTVPRELSKDQVEALEMLSHQVVSRMESRLHLRELIEVQSEVVLQNRELNTLLQEKSKFLSVLSHDIRQPLSNIMACSDMLQNPNRSLDQSSLVDAVYESSKFLYSLVTDLLQVIKQETQPMQTPELNLEETDIIPLINKVVRNNSVYATKKKITINLRIRNDRDSVKTQGDTTYKVWEKSCPFPVRAMVDRKKFEQVVNNLLSNAVKFSYAKTTIDVLINVTKENSLQVSISDQGQGIPESELPHMFEPWKRISVKPTAGEDSSGIGLSIVKDIMKAHKGDIWVISKQNIGSTFVIKFPLLVKLNVNLPADRNRLYLGQSTPTPSSPCTPPTRKLRILCAEDNLINQKIVASVLTKRGHDVTVANDGQECLSIYEQAGRQFDVLLLDQEMPKKTGTQVIQEIRQSELNSNRHIPIVTMSGQSNLKSIDNMRLAGADICCSKPLNLKLLIQSIESSCAQKLA